MPAKVPPLREPTRSLGSEREEKASAHFGRDDSLVADRSFVAEGSFVVIPSK
jgi:hypothetical protein